MSSLRRVGSWTRGRPMPAGRVGARGDRPLRRFGILLAGIVLVFVYGVAGYMLLGFGLIDALYMTALALTTAGFTPAGELDGAAKVFTVTIAILGVSAFLAVLGLLGGLLLDREFAMAARRRRMQKRIDKLKDHHVICAYGRVGRTVAREYEAEGTPFVVIDMKEELQDQLRADGVPFVIGDPSSEAVLRRAGIEQARALVCAVDSDAANVYIALMARSLNPAIFIVARAGERDSAERLYRAGADRVVSPYVTSGRHMALLALRPRVLDSFDVVGLGDDDLRLDEIGIEEGSPVVGRTIREACGDGVPLLLRRSDGQLLPNPPAGTHLAPGDLILVLGRPGDLRSVEGGAA